MTEAQNHKAKISKRFFILMIPQTVQRPEVLKIKTKSNCSVQINQVNSAFHPVMCRKKTFIQHIYEKPCSKFGEDRSINRTTILSTDNGHRTHQSDFIFCIGQTMIMFVEQFSTMPTRSGLVKAPSTCRSADIDERASLQSLVATESMLDLRNFASLHFIMQLFMAEMT